MDTLKKLDQLFRLARQADAPVFHVSDHVIAHLGQRDMASLIPLSVFAGISAVAATVLFMLAVNAYQTLNGPLMELITPLQETALW